MVGSTVVRTSGKSLLRGWDCFVILWVDRAVVTLSQKAIIVKLLIRPSTGQPWLAQAPHFLPNSDRDPGRQALKVTVSCCSRQLSKQANDAHSFIEGRRLPSDCRRGKRNKYLMFYLGCQLLAPSDLHVRRGE